MTLDSARYDNVDVICGFHSKGEKVDLAVASDRYNDMIRIVTIDSVAFGAGAAPLTEVTAPGSTTARPSSTSPTSPSTTTSWTPCRSPTACTW